MKRQGAAFWLTGLPGSGKTALTHRAKDAIPSLVHLQMDEMRRLVTPKPTYSEPERDHLYLSLVFTAMVLTKEGMDVVIDATANMRKWRDEARARIANFHEIYVKCPIDICREREMSRTDGLAPKDIYKKAREGWPVPGVNVPYEEPVTPELVIENDVLTLDEAAGNLVTYIMGVLGR
jgi:adenylylsulfate kinase